MNTLKKYSWIALAVAAVISTIVLAKMTRGSNMSAASLFNLPLLSQKIVPVSRASAAPKKMVVVLYKFSNEAGINPPFDKEAVRKNVFDINQQTGISMSQFISLSTYGNVSFTGKTSADGSTDVHGWYTVPETRTGCGTGNPAYDIETASDHAIQMAIADGVHIDDGDFVVTGTFPNGCTTGGRAIFWSIPGTQGVARKIMMNNTADWSGTLHEIGHLSVAGVTPIAHSNSTECIDTAGTKVPFGQPDQTCTTLEYGSPLSVMGGWISGAAKTRLFDAQNRIESGYFSPTVITAATPGTYDIRKINFQDGQLLEVAMPEATTLMVNGSPAFTNTVPTRIRIEARDFETFEQDADTYPHTNMLSISRKYIGNSVIANAGMKKLVAPNTGSDLSMFGTTVSNLGATPGDPEKVRIQLSYNGQGTIPFSFPKTESLSAASLVNVITVNPDGTFIKPNLVLKNTGADAIDFKGRFIDTVQLLHSSAGAYSGGPFITNSGNSVGLPYSSITIGPGETKTYALFDGNTVLPNMLTYPHNRWVYKMTSRMERKGTINSVKLTTYFIFGKFSVSELVGLGVPVIRTDIEQVKKPVPSDGTVTGRPLIVEPPKKF